MPVRMTWNVSNESNKHVTIYTILTAIATLVFFDAFGPVDACLDTWIFAGPRVRPSMRGVDFPIDPESLARFGRLLGPLPASA